jgi:hypothetical protein
MINWDYKEKQLEFSLAKIHMLHHKAMTLALELAQTEDIPVDEKESITFLFEMSVGDDNDTRISLRRTIGELLRMQTSICKFN